MKDGNEILELVPIVGIVALAVAGIFNILLDASISSEAIAAGLQQCVVDNKTVWQKECRK
jgi:hypothetical protein